jgi:3-hydroxyisobutyrate dehydrogenase
MKIGVAGLGKMGAAMAARLQDCGHDLVVWNRSPGRAAALVDAGAELAASPADLAARADTVISMLFDADAVNGVFEGPQGLMSGDVSGRLFIEMSTVRPVVHQGLARAMRAAGGAYLECPVGGTVGPARTGKLIGLAGGEAADFARAKPVLDQLCRRLEHCGPTGAGAAMKLAINLPLLVFWQAFGEANALVRHLGRDTGWLVELFADSSGGANVLKARGPAIAAALAGNDPGPPTFAIDAIRKDLRTMQEEAQARGFDLPLAARTLDVFDEIAAEGWGEKDCAWLPAYWPSHKAQ